MEIQNTENSDIPNIEVDPGRRDFLKLIAVATGTAAVATMAGCKEKKSLKEYDKAQDVINPATFEKGSFDNFSRTFSIIFSAKFGLVHYFDIKGNLLKSKKLPKNWHNYSSKEKQDWHNENRKSLGIDAVVLPKKSDHLGYPFVSVPSSEHASRSRDTMKKVVESRLRRKHRDSRYFGNKPKTIPEAIKIIAGEYGIPADIVLAVGAQESNYYKYRSSSANAKGILQMTPGKEKSAHDAYKYRIKNPSFRKGSININNTSDFHNRFVQIELFCSYYKFMEKIINKPLHQLNKRIRKIDENYKGLKKSIVLSAAFNAGPDKINGCIDRFINLSDSEIKDKLGQPPYDSNVMMGIISTSFGANRVGSDVFFYCSKVDGWRRILKKIILSENEGFDRRDFIKLASVATAAALVDVTGCTKEKSKPSISSKEVKEIVEKSKSYLDKRYKRLRNAVRNSHGKYEIGEFLQSEENEFRNPNVFIGSQVRMLLPEFKDMLSGTLRKNKVRQDWRSGKRRKRMIRKCRRNSRCWRDMRTAQNDWKKDQIKSGELIKMKENSSKKPYYCQQVGMNGGVKNSEYGMYMHKDMEPILESLVHLVNYQIDLFNKNPRAYGYPGVKIDHVDAIKVSGAFRSLRQQYVTLKSASKTSDLSAHLTGRAIDIGALSPVRPDASIVRFTNGKELKSSDTDNPRRNIISKMIGRAFSSMREPLSEKGIKIKPLWENGPRNWHVAIGKK